MTKYQVTQEVMDELIEWRNDNHLDPEIDLLYAFVDGDKIQKLPVIVDTWWLTPDDPTENNNRLIAILRWLNGEDVFEIDEEESEV